MSILAILAWFTQITEAFFEQDISNINLFVKFSVVRSERFITGWSMLLLLPFSKPVKVVIKVYNLVKECYWHAFSGQSAKK